MSQNIVETVTFDLVDGMTTDEFVDLGKTSEDFVRTQPGFVFRRLSVGPDGRWTDAVIWQDMETALAAAQAFPKQPFAAGFMAAIVPDSVNIRHEEIRWVVAPA